MNHLFILAGPSMIGKTTLLSKIIEAGLCEGLNKYSSRKKREKGFDDIIHVDDIYDSKYGCDIIYEMYDNLYGVNTNEIKAKLQNKNQIVIISEVNAINKIIEIFDENATVILLFLSGNMPIGEYLRIYLTRREVPLIIKEDIFLLMIDNEESRFKIKDCLPDREYHQFIQRYENQTDFEKIFHKKKNRFILLDGQSIDTVYNKFNNIYKEKTKGD